jgi:hypothetical protein
MKINTPTVFAMAEIQLSKLVEKLNRKIGGNLNLKTGGNI